MKKVNSLFMLLIICVFTFIINVKAEVCDTSTSGGCSSLISSYNEGKSKNLTITSGSSSIDNVTVYGKSVCSGSTCKFDYSGFTSYKELLKTNVVCSGGEKYIKAEAGTSDAIDYTKSTNDTNKNGTFYFSEKYSVSCLNEAVSGADELKTISNISSITSTTSSSTNSYSSSSTETSPETGVETYYIILGFVAIISCVITLSIKKHNLFKNI